LIKAKEENFPFFSSVDASSSHVYEKNGVTYIEKNKRNAASI